MKTSFLLYIVLFLIISNSAAIAQKIDADSLLVRLNADYKLEKSPR
jgi:hypothetical protein